MGVSIHTPTKGVTVDDFYCIHKDKVSIHTPTKGVTNGGKTFTANNGVSIHTPTKGVTLHCAFIIILL